MSLFDDRYGDIWFEEEDPDSECYNPESCRNVYIDLALGIFDINPDDYYENYAYDEEYDDY
jgi:hypothetical protein